MRFAIPLGRLLDPTLDLFTTAGIPIRYCPVTQRAIANWRYAVEIIPTPEKFIPSLIASNDLDAGIAGYDYVKECASDTSDGVDSLLTLRFPRPEMNAWGVVVLASNSDTIQDVKDLSESPRLITAYENMARRFLATASKKAYITACGEPAWRTVGKIYRLGIYRRPSPIIMQACGFKEIHTVMAATPRLITALNLDARPNQTSDAVQWLWETLSQTQTD